ncbi:MAG: competence/damage-inducible protein A [Chloroflexi bacterium]|nr:competence/damage-inducible protein A [Chloroflexota bacterium]MBI3734534.1 competence/damage-inducible protein A [Chloroflexota bacterium]
MSASITCEIIAIGNELLIGDVQDTNTHWLIQRLTGLGGFVRRCFIVRDEFPAIAAALHASLADHTRLIITSGGLGPTGDDLTLAAVAAALSLPLVEHAQAMAMLAKRYQELAQVGWVKSAEMNAARRKMGMFPQGAEPIYNPVGGAPAAQLQVDATTIVCLPGVPPELKGIFTQSMQPLLNELFGSATYQLRSLIVDCQDESFLAAKLQSVVERHPQVYIKSRAKRFGPDMRINVTLSATGPDDPTVTALIDAAQADLQATLEALGLHCEMDTTRSG